MSPPVREGKQLQGLDRTALLSLMLATFSLSVGYSIVLPILPFLIEQLSPAADPAAVSRHTGLITSTYILAVFLFAPVVVLRHWLASRVCFLHSPLLCSPGFHSPLLDSQQ